MTKKELNDRSKKQALIFGQNIRILRKKNKLSQAEMAKCLEIGIKTLSSLERGEIPPRLSCDILFRIYNKFGVYPGDMFSPLED